MLMPNMLQAVARVFLLLLFVVSVPTASFAAGGDYVWPPYNVAVVGNQEAKASMADSQGNLILVGSTDSNGTDIHIVKVKADGTGTLWSVSKDSTGGADVATAVVVDSNDDVIVTGYVWDGPDYNDIYTAKYAGADGALIWEHIYDGTGSGHDYPTAITVDAVGNVFVTGYMQAASTKDSIILLKYDPNNGPNPDGTPLWEIAYDAGNNGHDRAFAIVADDVHGVAITGESQNATPDFDCLTVKYDTAGNQVWERRYTDPGDGRGEALAMDADGNVVMAGYISNGTDQDFYVVEYAAADSPANWVNIYDSGFEDHATALWLDENDNVYVAGDDATLTTGSDIHVARYDGVTGVESWSNSYNSGNGYNDMGLDLAGDSNGELFVVGYKNDGVGGLDDVLALKVKKDDGTALWLREYDGIGKSDRSLCACFAADGNLLVGGWSDRWTSGSNDYDFLALKFESGALNEPTALAASVISNTSIDLTWSDNSAAEDNFILERKIGALGTYNVIATLAANTVSYNDSGLLADTRYYYRVKSYSAATGNSPYSNEVDAKTTIVSYDPPSLHFEYGGAAGGDDFAEAIAVGADNHPVVTGFITGSGTSFDYYTIKLNRADLSEQWNARYNDGDNEVDVATAITVDSSNRVVVSGYSSLYGGGAGNTNDVYTIGYPADGSVESWADQYNGPDGNDDRSSAVASAIDGSDSTVVIGYGKNALFNDDIYVIKYLVDGTRDWVITPFDGGNDDYPAAVAFDVNGDVLVGGYTHNGTNKDFFIAKYSGTDGSLSWQQSFNGAADGDDVVTALAVDASGNLYVTGSSVNASGNSDIYTIKYSGTDGSLLWEQGFNGVGNGYDIGEGITFDPVDGSIMVGGTTFVGTGNHDYHLIRYAADGTLIWQKTLNRPISDEALYAMSVDRSGTVALTGTTNSGVNDDVLTVKYNSDGIILSASVYNGVDDSDDAPSSIVTNAYGETFVAGITTTASNDTDYMVFLAAGQTMQSPTPFTATQLYTEIDLNWTDNSLDESGFELERKVGTCDSANPWTILFMAAPGETSYMDTGLSVDSTFCYRIRSYNGSGESSRWAGMEVTTADPVAPSGLTATVQNTTDILLEWTDNTGSEQGFTLERCLGSACDFSTITSIDVPANSIDFIDNSVCSGQVYSYRLKAYKTNEWVTSPSSVTADHVAAATVAPSGLTSDWASEEWTELKWNDDSTDETGFVIERCAGSGCSSFAQLAAVVSPAGNQLHYRMDEASWNGTLAEVIDRSVAGNHGQSLGGSTTVPSGKYDRAGSFDGVDDYLSTPLVLDQSAATTGATLAAWVYPASSSADNHFVFGTDDGGNDWGLLRSAGTWSVANGSDAGLVNTGIAVDLNSWQHLAVVFNPVGGVTLYKNGVAVWTDASIDFDDSSGALTLGRRGSLNQEFFDGRLDEVSVFDQPLVLTDIQVLYNHGLGRYNDWSVTDSTTYNYQVKAYKDSGCSWTSAASNSLELTTTPPVPAELVTSLIDSGHIGLTWSDNTTTETGFRIERCAGSGCSNFTELDTVGADVTSYIDAAVCADANVSVAYNYRVVAINGVVWSSLPSAPAEAALPALIAPTSLSIGSVSEDTVNLEWDYFSSDLSGFRLSRCDGDATFCADSGNFGADKEISLLSAATQLLLPMDESAWDGTAGEVTDISGSSNDGTGYGAVTTFAAGKYGRGGWFDGVDDYIATPLNIDQSATSPGVTFEAWAYPTVNNSNYKYVISTDNGGADWSLYYRYSTWYIMNGSSTAISTGIPVTFNAWQHIVVTFHPATGVVVYKNGNEGVWSSPTIGVDTNDANVTIGRRGAYTHSSYHFQGGIDEVAIYNGVLSATEALERYQRHYRYGEAGLLPDSPYSFRVKAYKNHPAPGCSWESNFDQTGSATQAPAPPDSLSVTAIDSTQIDLEWSDNATSETAYRVQWCQGAACTFDADPQINSVVLAADSISLSDTSVCQGDTYKYRIRAEKTDGPVWETAWLSGQVTTVTATPPGNFAATAVSESEIGLQWDDLTVDEDQFVIERCQSATFDCGTPTLISNFPGTVLGRQLHYRMDEALWNGTVNEVVDESGQGKHGRSYNGAVTSPDGKYARSGYFDGVNDYVITPLYLDQTATGTGVTLEAWVKPTLSDVIYRNVFSTENGGYDWGLKHYNGYWYVNTGEGQRSTGIAVDIDAWQHVAVVFSPGGAAIKFYKNGVATTLSASYIGYDTGTNPLNLGRQANSSYYYQGFMDEVAVYNRPLTQAEIDQHYQRQIDTYSLTDAGLNPGLPYSYRIKATKSASCSWLTAEVFATATTDDPPAPTALTIAATDTTTLDLSWTDNSGSETGYNLERCTGSGTACDQDSEFSTLDAALVPDSSSYNDPTVCEGATYSYRVRAEKSDGPIWQTAWEGPLAQTVGGKITPTALVATQVSEVQIDLSWTDSNTDETGFKIERCAGSSCSNFVEVATTAAGTTSYRDDQLDPDTSYSYQVKAYKTATCSWETAYSNSATVTTAVIVPSGLVASMVNTTQIDMAWTDNAATETATIVERCTGSGCSDFIEHGEVGPNIFSYSDIDACYGTTYNYRLKVEGAGLSSAGGGCWTRRAPLSFSAFAAGANAEIVVLYDTDMRADFGDIRFYDEDGKRELAYGLLTKADGVSANFLVELGSNENISIYYGNASATHSGHLGQFIEFQDDFTGTSIDNSKWLKIDPNGSITQNNDLLLNDVADNWTTALISQQTFTRTVGKEFYLDLTVPADTVGNNYIMIGWELNQTSNPSYNQLVHGVYWSNYAFNTYEKGGSKGATGGYTASTDYEMKIVLKEIGAKYFIKGGTYLDWTLIQETSTYNDATMRIAFTQNSHQMIVHRVKVGEPTIDAGVSIGPEQADACYSYGNTWQRGYSNEDQATTTSPVAPSGLLVTAITDTQVDLSWTDNTDVETGFKIERCSGSGCSNFAQIDTVAGNVTYYSDLSAPPSVESSYRVRAYKTSNCPWDSGYSNVASDLTFPAASSSLSATALNSWMIRLTWDDNASDEHGYEVEVLAASGEFVKVADLPANSVSFVDTMSLEPETEYHYRVRPYRSLDISPYSNVANETTFEYVEGDGTCAP